MLLGAARGECIQETLEAMTGTAPCMLATNGSPMCNMHGDVLTLIAFSAQPPWLRHLTYHTQAKKCSLILLVRTSVFFINAYESALAQCWDLCTASSRSLGVTLTRVLPCSLPPPPHSHVYLLKPKPLPPCTTLRGTPLSTWSRCVLAVFSQG